MSDNVKELSQWSVLWKRGYITTFGPSTPNNYGANVKAVWNQQFDKLEKDAVILDVAAGNGAIATIAAEYSEMHGKNFSILAADAAEINFELVEESRALDTLRSKIKFYSQAPCEQLPFKDSSIDMVCSQFGIEYSVMAVSLPEVARVLRDGGRFVAVMHHSVSSIIHEAARECRILEEILYEHKVFEILEDYYTAVGEVHDEISLSRARQYPQAVASAKQLDKVFSYLIDAYPESSVVNRVRSEVSTLLSDQVYKPETERLTLLRMVFDDLTMMSARQRDLQQAAISPLMMRQLKETAEDSGLNYFTYSEIRSTDGKVNGWLVNATR